jgi:AraC family transcriptional regulator
MSLVSEKIRIKNMVCNCCIRVITALFRDNNVKIIRIELGLAHIEYDTKLITQQQIADLLFDNGFEIISDRDRVITEQIKIAVIELVYHLNNVDSIVRKSEYLVEKLGMSYPQLSRIFSKHEALTLEKFIILHKIERIKQLLESDEFTISEIAYMMDYSSVQHLSNQFRAITNITLSEYKKSPEKFRKSIDSLV